MVRPQRSRTYVGSSPNNTPAADYWTMDIYYTPKDSLSEAKVQISFLPTGEIDIIHTRASDLEKANSLLAPTITLVERLLPNFNYWRLTNWLFVSWYWLFLSDFGHNAPTTYLYVPQSNVFSNAYYTFPDFTTANQHPPTNNIFYNDTLFEIYYEYLNNTLSPLAPLFGQGVVQLPSFNRLSNDNRLEASSVSFVQSYSCTERRMKGWLSVFISVAVADYAFLTGAYTVFTFIVGKRAKVWQKGEGNRAQK
jgi:hypothetical protein